MSKCTECGHEHYTFAPGTQVVGGPGGVGVVPSVALAQLLTTEYGPTAPTQTRYIGLSDGESYTVSTSILHRRTL